MKYSSSIVDDQNSTIFIYVMFFPNLLPVININGVLNFVSMKAFVENASQITIIHNACKYLNNMNK